MSTMMSDYVCVDFEASGLHRDCYPLELAIARPILRMEKVWLIKPTASWLEKGVWEEQASSLHGIAREEVVRDGIAPQIVVAEFLAGIHDAQVVSDCPKADGGWLRQLFSVADVRYNVEIHDLDEVARRITWSRGLDHNQIVAEAHRNAQAFAPKTHRALQDARHNAAVIEFLQRWLPG